MFVGMRNGLNIKNWAEDDRPREKLMLKGRQALSDAELIAILIRSGTKNESAVELARLILQQAGSIDELARWGIDELTRIKGIGKAKALSIISGFELGRRRNVVSDNPGRKPRMLSSTDLYHFSRPFLSDLGHEEFWVVLLNRANYVIKKQQISKGGVTSTVVDPKLVFRVALDHMACGLVLCHNHPSGNCQPSSQDCNITRQLVNCGRMLEINVVDHLIITDHEYFSFSDAGML
ncbi:MAG: DNA repair protein RadC [Bacteroidetes bacterium]|nr:MAG: DNA repair protein RadC [Bacteroidota bacterium]